MTEDEYGTVSRYMYAPRHSSRFAAAIAAQRQSQPPSINVQSDHWVVSGRQEGAIEFALLSPINSASSKKVRPWDTIAMQGTKVQLCWYSYHSKDSN